MFLGRIRCDFGRFFLIIEKVFIGRDFNIHIGHLLVVLMMCMKALVLGQEIVVEPHLWILLELLSW